MNKTNHHRKNIARWLKEHLDIRLGIELWALELADPVCRRRPHKFTRAARVLGWVRFVAQHRHAPVNIGCACETQWQTREAVA